MSQITVRAETVLLDRVRLAAEVAGCSMNEYVVMVLDAASNPLHAGSKALEIRERLLNAGLLSKTDRRSGNRPSAEQIRAAGRRASAGTALSDLVTESR